MQGKEREENSVNEEWKAGIRIEKRRIIRKGPRRLTGSKSTDLQIRSP